MSRSYLLESLSQPLLLRVPTPDCQTLSFCEPNVRDLERWLAALPKANLGETARRLYQAMIELNRLSIDARKRVHLLEKLRPEIDFVCGQLERHFLNQPIVLSERPRKTLALCQALQNHLAMGYKLIVVQLVAQHSDDPPQLLTVALQRSIQSLRAMLVRACQLYSPTPEGLWLELHQLYSIAAERALQRTLVRDELARHAPGLSVEQSYLAALMLGCARSNQLRQQHIGQLAGALEGWVSLVSVQVPSDSASLFAVAPQIDGPPRYRTLLQQKNQRPLLGIDTRFLSSAISEHLLHTAETPGPTPLPGADQLSRDLLRHLDMAWGGISERSFQRLPAQGRLRLCVGMTALHYYLAGQRPFNELLQLPGTPTSAVFKLNNAAPDVWATAFDAQTLSDNGPLPSDKIEFVRSRPQEPAPGDAEPTFPTYEAELINHSPGGFCLACPPDMPGQLQAGELLGLQEGDRQDWSVAVVRWIRQVRGGAPQMGVELIAPNAQPCGLRLLRKQAQGSEYLRALLLPEISAISRPATLIAPGLPFQEGHKVQINQNGEEHRALLHRRQASIGNYNQFEYRLVGQPEAVQETSITAQQCRTVGGAEDFDSLWKSL